MKIKILIDEDFVNYKYPSMFLGTISCNGKCCIEARIPFSVCQNDELKKCKIINVDNDNLCKRYLNNNITKAIVIGGLEPFEQFTDMLEFINIFRYKFNCNDDIVIYTGFNKNEIIDEIETLEEIENIIIKYGRFIPNAKSRFDEVLGITLISDNQYAEKIS